MYGLWSKMLIRIPSIRVSVSLNLNRVKDRRIDPINKSDNNGEEKGDRVCRSILLKRGYQSMMGGVLLTKL
jgi:hypothetical protein